MNKIAFSCIKIQAILFLYFCNRCILFLFFRWTFLKIDSLCSKKLQSENGKNL